MDQVCEPRKAVWQNSWTYCECTFYGWKVVDGAMKAVIEDYAGAIRYVEPHEIRFR